MVNQNEKIRNFAIELFKVNAVKFGEYKTKVGLMTPVYCDLRVIVSYPKLLDSLAELLIERMELIKGTEIICGVPYTALPIATAVSLKTGLAMVMRRKEAKDYGTKKLIEGVFDEGATCLIIEDVVTSGGSILETYKDLIGAGIKCTDAIVLLNREQGGENILLNNGIRLHALLGLSEFMLHLKNANCIDDATITKVTNYLKSNQIDASILLKTPAENRLVKSFQSRIQFAKNPIASDLFKIMSSKQTTLCVAADFTDSTDLLNLAEEVGPYICVLKTHIDLLDDFHANLLKPLKEIAERHNFLLFEDRKFADIGKTVELQFTSGIYRISSWAQLVTAHSLTGKGVLDAIKGKANNCGVFLLAETSAAGNLIDETYTKKTVQLALDYPELVAGIVCQRALFKEHPGLLQLTPGVQLDAAGDNLGQQYNSPETVVNSGADIAVVGRGITKSADIAKTALTYKKLLWDAYVQRIEAQ